jgi:AhpD family alkylhydroperoxidase
MKLLRLPINGATRRPPSTKVDFNLAEVDLDSRLLELVRLRVVQIHRCPWCEQAHLARLKAQGENGVSLQSLRQWRDRPIFTDREEAALNLAEALTRYPVAAAPEKILHVARLFFNESEMICLTLAILAVNDWHYLHLKRGWRVPKPSRPPHE